MKEINELKAITMESNGAVLYAATVSNNNVTHSRHWRRKSRCRINDFHFQFPGRIVMLQCTLNVILVKEHR